MHRQQRDIIFRKFRKNLAFALLRSLPALPGCAGVFHSPRVAFVRCLRGKDLGREREKERGAGKTTGRFSYREHVRAEVNFERRMSLLKLVVFPTSSPLSYPRKKSFSSIIAPAPCAPRRRIISVHAENIVATRCF